MKSPHTQRPDNEAREATEKFIAKYAGRPGTKPKSSKPKSSRSKPARTRA